MIVGRYDYTWRRDRAARHGTAHREAARLPQRVARAIRVQEEESEVLIGWAQFGLLLVFGTLYFLAPMAGGGVMGGIRPVPLALGFYFLFTVVRLALAYRWFLPAWLLDLSIVLDMALLMGLIWSFHIQYDQPPAFYLKAPTLTYVFIFIALRALRFDPRFVLTAGVVAATGWLGLLCYALAAEGGTGLVTRNYVDYLTDNRILIGAEFDKVISIVLVTAILAFALARGRRLLILAASEGEAARDLKRFFAPDVADAITRSDHRIAAGQGEAHDVAILMIDIRGFTRLATTLPPEEVMRLLGDYQRRMLAAIQLHGGAVDKFLGDGIMATFGAVRPSATHAADALGALDAVLAAARDWAAERIRGGVSPVVEINAAAADGRVVVGAVGDAERLEFTVIGDAVNLAAKLEKHCKAEHARGLAPSAMVDRAIAQGWTAPATLVRRDGRQTADLAGPINLAVWT